MIIENNKYNDKIIQFVQFCRDEANFEEGRSNLKKALTAEEYSHSTEQDVIDLMLADFEPETDTVTYDFVKQIDE